MLIKNSPSPLNVAKSFSDVQTELKRLDASLSEWSKSGGVCPKAALRDDFYSAAGKLDDASIDLRGLHSEKKELLEALKSDTLHVAINAGHVQIMAEHRLTFGPNWGKMLDTPIADTETSVTVASEPASGIPVEMPSPLKTVRQLSDLQADLSNMDARLTEWERNGHIYPNKKVCDQFVDLADRLFEARTAMRDLHPEQLELVAGLQGDMLDVAGGHGRTQIMADRKYVFKNEDGWSTALDKSMRDVGLALDVLLTPDPPSPTP